MVFRWRRRNEGFEWRTYVRTTILVRRHERRQRAEDVKAAAVFGVKQAGAKGADAAGAALQSVQKGSLSALRWTGDRLSAGARKSGTFLALAARRGAAGAKAGWIKGRAAAAPKLTAAGSAAKAAAIKAASKMEPVAAPLRAPGLQLALKLIATVAAAGSLIRAYQFGWDGQTLIAAAVAATSLLIIALAQMSGGDQPFSAARQRMQGLLQRLPNAPLPDRLHSRGAKLAGLGLIAAAAISGFIWTHGRPRLPHFAGFGETASLPDRSQPAGSSKKSELRDANTVEGSATAQSGDTLRISGTTVRLAGIEAPDRSQPCQKPGGKRWDCAASARDALSRLLRGRRVICNLSGQDTGGVRTGQCQTSDTDIAAELVRNGHVFAQNGLFAAYGTLESEAQAAKSGLWAGDAQRPAEWRAARWEEAKRMAPDGCPIKGRVYRKSGKVYMLPWSPDYDRARVDTAQGERWFCSESEAQSAGWKPL